MMVVLDQFRSMSVTPLELPIPRDIRLKKIYDRLSSDPGDNRTLEEWGKIVAATGRTLARRFREETGMSFGQWRQQIRILEALRRLTMDEPVATVAIELGIARVLLYPCSKRRWAKLRGSILLFNLLLSQALTSI